MSENNHDEDKSNMCKRCDRQIGFGEDAFRMQEGVIGPRGFVELGEAVMLCSEDCLRAYFADGDGEAERLLRRIP